MAAPWLVWNDPDIDIEIDFWNVQAGMAEMYRRDALYVEPDCMKRISLPSNAGLGTRSMQ